MQLNLSSPFNVFVFSSVTVLGISVGIFILVTMYLLGYNLSAIANQYLRLPSTYEEIVKYSAVFSHGDREDINNHIMTKSSTIKYPVRHVLITTCGQLYQNWKTVRPIYEKAPQNGLTITVEYADTKFATSVDNIGNVPVVLALHGAPGSHADFAPLIKELQNQGVRVIAPNFPDYSTTVKTEVWRHSAEEKAEYLKDFLKAIRVNKVDMVLSHSSAIYPSLLLFESGEIEIKSFAFFNPGGHRRIKAMRPVWFTEGSVKVYQNKFGRTIFKTFGTTFLNITKSVSVKADNMHNVMLSATVMAYSGFRQLENRLIKLRESKIPTLLVFSENDKLIEKEIFYEMANILGAQEDDFDVYNDEGILESKGTGDGNIKVMTFQSGGHYAFLKYTTQVIEACRQLLSKVLNESNQKYLFDDDCIHNNMHEKMLLIH